jgi:two-component system, OmpR family, sensor histidine kinase BaeS
MLLLTMMTLVTGTVSVWLYANVVRNDIARLSPETRAAITRDFGLPGESLENPHPLEPVRIRFVTPLIVSLLFGSSACLLVSLIVARRFVRPLEHLTQTAQRIARGDLSARTPALLGPGEIASLIENVNDMAARLEHFDAERRASSAAIAHELRTPLTILRGRLEAIRDDVIALDHKEISNLLSQTEVLSRLVTDLRTLSLADAGQISLERHTVDVRALVAQVVNSFEARVRV